MNSAFSLLCEVIFTTAGAEVSTNSEILKGNAALVNDANPKLIIEQSYL